jgi:hypothetical protein
MKVIYCIKSCYGLEFELQFIPYQQKKLKTKLKKDEIIASFYGWFEISQHQKEFCRILMDMNSLLRLEQRKKEN